VVRCDPKGRWGECSGVIAAGRRDNVPSGELMTCPASVDGIYVADSAIGDAGGTLSGRLAHPLKLRIAGGRVVGVESADGPLAAKVKERMRRGANLDRVGIVSFGTNVGINSVQDDIFTDQKRPGFHVSLGFTSPAQTGATWDAGSWIAFTAIGSDVDIDGTPVMRSGRYLVG
jgi:leucyl aminopeptidase (aminopeptidase T)